MEEFWDLIDVPFLDLVDFPSSRGLCEKTQSDHALSLLKSLQSLRETGTACDFVVKVQSKTFPVHRSVLAACSDYFRAMFEHDMRETSEGVVDMKEVQQDAVEKCISFMYTGVIDVDFTNVQDILHVASLMQLESLMQHCFSYMQMHMTSENCLFVRNLAKFYSFDEERKKADEYAGRYLNLVMGSDDFFELSLPELINLIKDTPQDYHISWLAALNWIKSNSVTRFTNMNELLQNINLPRFSAEFLFSTVLREDLVLNSEACRELVSREIYEKVEEVSCSIHVQSCYDWKDFTRMNTEHKNAKYLSGIVNDFMMNHFEEIAYDERFLSLSREDIFQFLHSPVRPVLLWQSILKWLKHDAGRYHLLEEMLKDMKLDDFTIDCIKQVFLSQPMAKQSLDCEIILLGMICSKIGVSHSDEEGSVDSECGACAAPSHGRILSQNASDSLALLDNDLNNIRWMNLKTNQWTEFNLPRKTRMMRVVSLNDSLYLLCDDQLFVLRGSCYWTQLEEHPGMPDKRTNLVAFQDRIYTLNSEDMHYYYPVTDEWSQNIPVAEISNEFCVTSSDSHIYVIGGHSLQNRCLKYSPIGRYSNRWSSTSPMKEKRHNAAAAFFNGSIYVLGGFYASKALDTVECYNPITDTWCEITHMRYCHRRFSACVANGRLYAVGGAFGDDGSEREERDAIEAYIAEQNRWITCRRMDNISLPISACCFQGE